MEHVACKSVPEQTVKVARRGAVVEAGLKADRIGAAVSAAVAATGPDVAAAAAEQQLSWQFKSIHAREAPVHCPWDAQSAQFAWLESVPRHELAVAGVRGSTGTAVAMGERAAALPWRGASVGPRDAVELAGAAVSAEQQLRLQLDSIQACAAPVHCP